MGLNNNRPVVHPGIHPAVAVAVNPGSPPTTPGGSPNQLPMNLHRHPPRAPDRHRLPALLIPRQPGDRLGVQRRLNFDNMPIEDPPRDGELIDILGAPWERWLNRLPALMPDDLSNLLNRSNIESIADIQCPVSMKSLLDHDLRETVVYGSIAHGIVPARVYDAAAFFSILLRNNPIDPMTRLPIVEEAIHKVTPEELLNFVNNRFPRV